MYVFDALFATYELYDGCHAIQDLCCVSSTVVGHLVAHDIGLGGSEVLHTAPYEALAIRSPATQTTEVERECFSCAGHAYLPSITLLARSKAAWSSSKSS